MKLIIKYKVHIKVSLFSLKPKEMAKIRLNGERDFEQKIFTRSGLEGGPKLLKAFFSRLFSCKNYEALEVPTREFFHPLI